ncbi:site-specific integrase [Candidatus Sumerlaeota bacterium]|nr:site-specific integrase [Candidatus Sumerlaeota bacterium]
MSTDLVKSSDLLPALRDDLEASKRHFAQSWSASTLRAYQSDWADWEEYCHSRGVNSLPAEPMAVAGYLSALAEGNWRRRLRLATIERRRAAISHIHRESGHADPCADPRVARVLSGIRRQLTVSKERKSPVRAADLKRMVAKLADDPRSLRDKALLLVGFATGCRRSELVALQVADVRRHRDGLIVEVRRSKTDQFGEGLIKLVRMGKDSATCPVRALQKWLTKAGITAGPIFREITNALVVKEMAMSERGVARAVQRAALAAGMNPKLFAGHSLRAGYVTEADARGAKTTDIMAQTGHRNVQMIAVYTRYNLDEKFEKSSALDLGL